jgi:hypothetical protein
MVCKEQGIPDTFSQLGQKVERMYLHKLENEQGTLGFQEAGNDIALNVQNAGASTEKSPKLGSWVGQVPASQVLGDKLKTSTGAASQQPHMGPTSHPPVRPYRSSTAEYNYGHHAKMQFQSYGDRQIC